MPSSMSYSIPLELRKTSSAVMKPLVLHMLHPQHCAMRFLIATGILMSLWILTSTGICGMTYVTAQVMILLVTLQRGGMIILPVIPYSLPMDSVSPSLVVSCSLFSFVASNYRPPPTLATLKKLAPMLKEPPPLIASLLSMVIV